MQPPASKWSPAGVAQRVERLLCYVRRPELWALRRQGIGLETYLKLTQPLLTGHQFQTILDIGANVGQFALAALAAFPKAKVLSFEPLPECFDALQRNLKGQPRFQAFNCGLGSQTGEIAFERNGFNASSSFLKIADKHREEFPATANTEPTKVAVEQLDVVMRKQNVVGSLLVKIDVQGYEMEVIKGGVETMRRASLAIVETSLETLYEGQPLFEEVIAKMSQLGFGFAGSFDEILSPRDGRVLQVDALFVNREHPQATTSSL